MLASVPKDRLDRQVHDLQLHRHVLCPEVLRQQSQGVGGQPGHGGLRMELTQEPHDGSAGGGYGDGGQLGHKALDHTLGGRGRREVGAGD